MRNLELFNSPNNGAKTMLDILDSTETSMGSRMLMRWLALPLKKINEINERLDIVNYLIDNTEVLNVLKDNIYQIGDLERLVSKASTKRINPKEVEKLKDSLLSIVPIKQVCLKSNLKSLNLLGKKLNDCSQLVDLISKELSDNPPSQLNKGNVINSGFNSELDELRLIRKSGKDFLDKMLMKEIEKTGISSLKISYNNVFGYYLEVRNIHKDKVPESWIRKQTLVNAERYITEELKDYEVKILSAQEKISIIEYDLFSKLVDSISLQILSLQKNSQLISRLDCLFSHFQKFLLDIITVSLIC